MTYRTDSSTSPPTGRPKETSMAKKPAAAPVPHHVSLGQNAADGMRSATTDAILAGHVANLHETFGAAQPYTPATKPKQR